MYRAPLRPSGLGLALATLVIAGCAAGPDANRNRLHYTLLEQPAQPIPDRVVLLPLDVRVSEASAGGVVEEVPEWSEQARANVRKAVLEALGKRDDLTVVDPGEFEGSTRQRVEEHLALYDLVAGTAFRMGQWGGAGWQHKRERFDYTIGNGLAFLPEQIRTDAALVVIGADVISTGGRKAMMAFGALLGVVIPPGASYMTAGLINLRSGDILWLNYALGGAGHDLRNPADASAVIGNLFANFPSKAQLAKAAAKRP